MNFPVRESKIVMSSSSSASCTDSVMTVVLVFLLRFGLGSTFWFQAGGFCLKHDESDVSLKQTEILWLCVM